MGSDQPVIKYTAREFVSIKEALSDYIKATAPELWTDFFESNLGVILMEIIAYVGDILSFSIDRVSQEVNLATCKRYASALRFANSVGYRPAGPTPASVDLDIVDYATTPLPDQLTVPEGTRVSAGGVTFETIQDYVFAAGVTAPSFPVVEGTSVTDTFTSDGSANQQYESTSEQVADVSWAVFVNGIEWTEVASLLTAAADNVYRVEYVQNSKIKVTFGDGTYGNRPSNGDIATIEYRVTKGTEGAITGGTIDQKVTVILGTATPQVTVTNALASSGAADRESLDHLKAFIPVWLKAVEKAITYSDYLALSEDYSGASGSVGKTAVQLRDSGTGPRVNAYLNSYLQLPDGSLGNPYPAIGTMYVIQDSDGMAPNGFGLYRYDAGAAFSYVPAPAYFAANIVDIFVWAPTTGTYGTTYTNASAALKTALEDYLDERSLITVRVCALDGTTTPVNIDLGTIYISPSYNLTEAETEVRTALWSLFSKEAHKPGSDIFLSDIYEAVNDVGAVDRFNLTVPSGDISAGDTELLTIGTITATFETAPEEVPPISGTCP